MIERKDTDNSRKFMDKQDSRSQYASKLEIPAKDKTMPMEIDKRVFIDRKRS